jgi:hypothetical protein
VTPPGGLPTALGGDPTAALRRGIQQLVTTINRNAGRLPAAAVVNARALTDTLLEIVETSVTRPLDVHAVISLEGMVEDYLPTTLQTYLAVEPELVTVARAGGSTPTESLMMQLSQLQLSAAATLAAVHAQDADALITQGSFLRTKFSRSDLDL